MEGWAMQVLNAGTDTWSIWYTETTPTFEAYPGEGGTIGGFAYQIDLSDLGLTPGSYASAVRIINLTGRDSYATVSPAFMSASARRVLVEDNTQTPTGFGGGSLDPDPLYLGVISSDLDRKSTK